MRSTPGLGKADRPVVPVFLFGLVAAYIVLQFTWWAWLLISKEGAVQELQAQLVAEGVDPIVPVRESGRTAWMVAGEGGVFLVLLLLALWLILRTVRHELNIARQQRDFLLAASHELRTPIAGLKLHLQTLKRPELDPTQRMELTGFVNLEVERLQSLIEKILLATRLDEPRLPLDRSEVDIAALLRTVLRNARASYAQGREVIEEVPRAVVIRTDADAFRSVASNLVENACKYAPATTPVEVRLLRSDHGWELQVADGGPGIPAGERSMVFRKFHRGGSEETRGAKGTGLGLYIVDRFMHGLNGRIEYRPRPGGGSIFAATFPQH